MTIECLFVSESYVFPFISPVLKTMSGNNIFKIQLNLNLKKLINNFQDIFLLN